MLWSSDQAMTPAEVRQALDQRLAYTTVMSTLSRLYRKGLVTRTARGRGYAYSAAVREDDHTAHAMAELLRRRNDRAAILSRFVSSLNAEDEALLQQLLRGAQLGEIDQVSR